MRGEGEKRVLAIGPHPDDVEFGCGGTLLQYCREGCNVFMLVLTGGEYGGDPSVRRREQEAACAYMGVDDLFWGGFVDTELQEDRNLIQSIDDVVKKTDPDLVLLPYPEDVHQDHRAVSLAGISATRYVPRVLFYEVPTSIDFRPNVFVDIGGVMEEKLHLLELHASQVDKTRVRNLTILESARACATFRGFQGRVKFAEGFVALRVLWRI